MIYLLEKLAQTYNRPFEKIDDFLIENIGGKVLEPLQKFAKVSDEYFWKYVLRNEKITNASFNVVRGAIVITALGVPYGLLTGNSDVVYLSFEGHVLADVLAITMSQRRAEYRNKKRNDL